MALSMKKILFLLVCLLTSFFSANAKYWICTLNTDQYMKNEPIVDGGKVSCLVPAGKISIFVSTPGMLPFSSHQYVKSGRSYSWTFYIERDKNSHN